MNGHRIADEEREDIFRRDMEDDQRREVLAAPAADRPSRPDDKTIQASSEQSRLDSSTPDRAAAASVGCGTVGEPFPLEGLHFLESAYAALVSAKPFMSRRLDWAAELNGIASRCRALIRYVEDK